MPSRSQTLALQRSQKQAKHSEKVSRFLAMEFIGKELKVVSSSCKDLRKVQGKIIDETTNTFVVEKNSQRKVVPKANNAFAINDVEVNGTLLVGKPEDRTKKFA